MMSHQAAALPPGKRTSPWQWLSTALIVAGGLLLAVSGLLATHEATARLVPDPPAGLDANPLPMLGDQATPTPRVVRYVTPSATPSVRSLAATPTATPLPTATPMPAPPIPEPPIRIVAAAINVDAPVVPVGWKQITENGIETNVWEVADFAAGWHNNSSAPGQPGNIVISGHHNTKGEVFRYVVDLKPGDAILLFTPLHVYTYTVESRFILRDKGMPEDVRRDNARWIEAFPDARLTLVTCWPYNTNTHRVIVVAKAAR
jgi:sortase A